ncbi:DNA polymerase beta domain protein region [Candidatus Vecturithrix granuli]|uniref:DNA polymerase beta domain protein region n=1 Tax=Vecturithrix granuli TaxID=1499967 RepID=A0A081CAK8_VECG1|nr:DNA polymerase beta domain protein region [Candidatus Vecturithrix granuli]
MQTLTNTQAAITPNLIADICAKIVAAIHPVKIIMFGSQADGTATADSDLDLFVIHDLPEPSRMVRRQIDRLFLHRWFSLDVIARNPQQVAANVADNNPFYTEHLLKRGVILYDRQQQTPS